MCKTTYIKLIAATVEDATKLVTYFTDQEFVVTQHGCGMRAQGLLA